ncbi:MAG: PRTRC system protein B [Bacteroidota bacterium]
MHNLTKLFTDPYHPIKGIVIYADQQNNENFFVESFDINDNGKMINAHPLGLQESHELGEILLHNEEENKGCFQGSGLLPENIVYLRTGKDGYVIWYTPAQKKQLYFIPDLKIADGVYPVPPLLWMASRDKLKIFALKNNERPSTETLLYNAPFFNIHTGGLVCMGTVEIDIGANCDLEEFMDEWHNYFFKSKFSHLLGERSPVKSNIIQLFSKLSGSKKQFPQVELLKSGKKLKQLLHGID